MDKERKISILFGLRGMNTFSGEVTVKIVFDSLLKRALFKRKEFTPKGEQIL